MSSVAFYHSGGGSNSDPMKDLGGAISSVALSSTEQLFEDVEPEQSRLGLVDYRCIYLRNTSSTSRWRYVKIFVDYERSGGSFIDLGLHKKDDIQKINIHGTLPPNEGDKVQINIPGYDTVDLVYVPNLVEWRVNFQNTLRTVDGLQDVVVDMAGTVGVSTDITFTINFLGQAACRYLAKIQVIGTMPHQTITVTHSVKGAPINTVAPKVKKINQPPPLVTFDYPLRTNPYEVGDLMPGDKLPLWIRRRTLRGHHTLIKDKVRISAYGMSP